MPEEGGKKKRRRKASPPAPKAETTTKKWLATREAIRKKYADEPDSEWRQWFIEIEQKRRASQDRDKPLVIFEVEKGEGKQTIARKKSVPEAVGVHIKKHLPTKFVALSHDYEEITRLWRLAVGDAIAAESKLHSFKQGVVTMEISSSTLLQEIRQFHQEAILADLRDIWTLRQPLLAMKYKIGKP